MKIKIEKTKFIIVCALLIPNCCIKAQNTAEVSGSGIAISSNGYIATNNHVVKDEIKIEVDVYKNGVKETYSAHIVKTDTTYDLAILKIDDPHFKTFGTIPYSFKMTDVKVGEKIFAMGYPQHNIQGDEVKVTDGIISSKTGFQNDPVTYQISSPIQHGNSGGPLFDNSRNLIGLINAGIQSAQNVGYAIKILYLYNFIDIIGTIPSMPSKTIISNISFPDKIKILSNFTVLIRVTVPVCDLTIPNELYNKINLGETYLKVNKLFNQSGTVESSSSQMNMVVWHFCDNEDISVRCWFIDTKLMMKQKSFRNQTCSNLLNENDFQRIKPGLSYADVCKLLQDNGDNTLFSSGVKTYIWYSCNNKELFYRVNFSNDKVQIIVNSK